MISLAPGCAGICVAPDNPVRKEFAMSFPSYRLPSDDRIYHLRRLEEERARAEAATDPGVRHIHRRLAEAYAERVGALSFMPGATQGAAE
jgi:hypothetical protein